jgi:uncharacterized integral membrane protein
VKNQQAFNKMESSIARILNQKPEVKRNNLKDRVIAGLILIIIVLAVYILVNKI